MTSGPLVTVVTPTYRRTDLLVRCVDSVMAQTHAHLEHVIVGDRCPVLPELEDELRRRDSRVRVLHLDDWCHPAASYTPGRIARARNAGIRAANGELLAHLDSDNTFAPDNIEGLVHALTDADADVAHSYRTLLWPDATAYHVRVHPWGRDLDEAKQVHAVYTRMGIYDADNPHLMADRITFNEERTAGVDCSQLLVRREVHRHLRFATRFTPHQLAAEWGEDDVFSWEVYRRGLRVACSGLYSLNFFVGGLFTAQIAEAARRDEAV